MREQPVSDSAACAAGAGREEGKEGERKVAQAKPSFDALLGRGLRRVGKFILRHSGLWLVLAAAFWVRWWFAHWYKVLPPGDVYNFINIARGLPEGVYSPGEKRLPFYPLLLLATHKFFGWELAGVVIAFAASLIALVFTYAIGRRMGMLRTALTGGLMLIAAQPFFVYASTRGYADTTTLALITAALWVTLTARSWRWALGAGVLWGLAAITRYEGQMAAIAALAAWQLVVFFRRRNWLYPLLAALVAISIFLPYAWVSWRNERPIFGAVYLPEAAGGDYGRSWQEVVEAIGMMWHRIGLWRIQGIAEETGRTWRQEPFSIFETFAVIFKTPADIIAIFSALGFLWLLWQRKFASLFFLVVVFFAATIPPAWYKPYERYDAIALPLAALLAAAGFDAVGKLIIAGTRGWAGKGVRWMEGAFLIFVALAVWYPYSLNVTRGRAEGSNGAGYAFYQAVHAARELPGRIAFPHHSDFVRLYFENRSVELAAVLEGVRNTEELLGHLRREGVSYIVLTWGEARKLRLLRQPDIKVVQRFSPYYGSEHDGAYILLLE